MFSHLHYVPVLKWKMGEYQALSRLAEPVKNRVTPLLEIPAVGYDHENRRASKSLDDHLKDFGKRLKAKWQARRCFVDFQYIEASERMADGSHPCTRVFSLARAEECFVVPVISLKTDSDCLNAMAIEHLTEGRGIALRLQLEDFDRPNLNQDIETALRQVAVGISEADLIVDLADKQFLPATAFVQTLIAAFQKIPSLNRWRTFTVVGTSYPKTISDLPKTVLVSRQEWKMYRLLVEELGEGIRIPTFGDYAVSHPDPVEFDMRVIKPFAKLRYTTPEDWYIARGTNVRKDGFEQYRDMCKTVMQQPFYDGEGFSDGDHYIAECANGDETTGNLSTWVWVSVNRHITRVVTDLANFHGASAPAE